MGKLGLEHESAFLLLSVQHMPMNSNERGVILGERYFVCWHVDSELFCGSVNRVADALIRALLFCNSSPGCSQNKPNKKQIPLLKAEDHILKLPKPRPRLQLAPRVATPLEGSASFKGLEAK